MADIIVRENAFPAEPAFVCLEVHAPRIDATLAPRLRSELVVLLGKRLCNVVLDISRCSYCDQTGLSAILVGARLCRTAGGCLVLLAPSETVASVFLPSQSDGSLFVAYREEQIIQFSKNI